MQRIVFAAIFSALSISSLANEMHEQEGIGYSKTRMKACDDAMLFIKKEALLSAGVIPIPAAPTSENTAHSSVTQNKAVEENQPGDELVKVLSKDEDVRMNSGGNYVCRVKAKISVDIENVVKHNSAFKGKLPDWVIAPPRKSGKITVIENDATLDGAIARTLQVR